MSDQSNPTTTTEPVKLAKRKAAYVTREQLEKAITGSFVNSEDGRLFAVEVVRLCAENAQLKKRVAFLETKVAGELL